MNLRAIVATRLMPISSIVGGSKAYIKPFRSIRSNKSSIVEL